MRFLKFSKGLVLRIGLLLLAGCSLFPVNDADWPAHMPPRAYYIDQYSVDATNAGLQTQDEYLMWVTRFYQGSAFYSNGWNKVEEELSARIGDSAEIARKMQRLGLLISGEWAKNNKTRLINTKHVWIWGYALVKSLDEHETPLILDKVTTDVEALLAQRLVSAEITENRYYPEEDIFKDIGRETE